MADPVVRKPFTREMANNYPWQGRPLRELIDLLTLGMVVEPNFDFLGNAISTKYLSEIIGSTAAGGAAATLVTNGPNGEVTLVTGTTDNEGYDLEHGQKNYTGNRNAMCAIRVKAGAAVTSLHLEVGFSDNPASNAMLGLDYDAGTPTGNGTDYATWIYDTDQTVDEWHYLHGIAGVDAYDDGKALAGYDAAIPGSPGIVPVAATYETFVVALIDTDIVFIRCNDNDIVTHEFRVGAGITATAALTPRVAAVARATTTKTITIDYMFAAQRRFTANQETLGVTNV